MNVKSEIAISLFRKFEYPKILFVFPSHFSVFTKKLEQLSNIQKFNVTHIVTGGEPLGESNRILFHKKWKAEVFNQYASTEVGPIGWECREHNGLHLIEESVYPEVIRVSANEKISSGEGQLIVTSLWEKSMPFIRYQIGEIVELFNEKCKCGWNTPRIKIKGRVDELIFLAGAVKIYPSYFETIIKSFKGLTDTYQIIIDKAGDKEQLFFRIEAEDWIINNFHKIKGKLVRVLSRATPDLSEAIYEDRLIDFPKIELLPIGTLSRTKLGKLKKRIIDKRIIDK
jgi:phenylacetate-coenzyme A ligase PaaK-like adenylate-forming protein